MRVLSWRHLTQVSTVNFLVKIVSFTILFYLEGWLFPKLGLTLSVIFILSLTLTLVGVTADLVIVPPLGNVPALTLGFFGMTSIVWSISFLAPSTDVTLTNAIFMVLPVGVIEFLLHRYILDALVR